MSDFQVTDRLVLRSFHSEDAAGFYEDVFRHPDLWELFELDASPKFSQAQSYVSIRADLSHRARFYDYVIVHKETDRLIGEINAAYVKPDCAELGYAIGPAFRGNGFASEAVTGLLEGLRNEGIREVYGSCAPSNHSSMRVLENNLFTLTKEIPHRIYQMEERSDLFWFHRSLFE